MTEYTLKQIAEKQSRLLDKLKEFPASNEALAILGLLEIQTLIAHVLADHIKNGEEAL